MFYEEVLLALARHEVRYLILDGMAVNLHGVPRMTGDLDLTVDPDPENIKALLDAFGEVGLKPVAPVDPQGLADPEQRRRWQAEKNLAALTFQRASQGDAYLEVDVLIEAPLEFEALYRAKNRLTAGGLDVDLVSLRHLIKIKESQGRRQDLADAEALKRVERARESDE